MTRFALLLSAVSLSLAVSAPVYAQGNGTTLPTKPGKIKKVKVKHGGKQAAQSTPANGTQVASGTGSAVSRAVPVGAAHSSFFATPLGILTGVGTAGGIAGGAAALSAKGSSSSPS